MNHTFFFPPPAKVWSTNDERKGSMHWSKRKELTKEWKGAARMHFRNSRGKAGTEMPPAQVRIHIPFKDERRRDPHNYCGTIVKAVVDGLVMAGAWPDDTVEYVEHIEPRLYKGNQVVVEIIAKEQETINGN